MERCLRNIQPPNPQLVIARSQIDLGKDTRSFHLVEQIEDTYS
jgi:hypothetical protein